MPTYLIPCLSRPVMHTHLPFLTKKPIRGRALLYPTASSNVIILLTTAPSIVNRSSLSHIHELHHPRIYPHTSHPAYPLPHYHPLCTQTHRSREPWHLFSRFHPYITNALRFFVERGTWVGMLAPVRERESHSGSRDCIVCVMLEDEDAERRITKARGGSIRHKRR